MLSKAICKQCNQSHFFSNHGRLNATLNTGDINAFFAELSCNAPIEEEVSPWVCRNRNIYFLTAERNPVEGCPYILEHVLSS